MTRKIISVVLSVCMVLSCLTAGVVTTGAATADDSSAVSAAADASTGGQYAQSTMRGSAILHCFNWKYSTIKANLADIAAAGYTAVQTSPVQQPKDYSSSWTDTSGQWWKMYQPLGLSIAPDNTSWLGNASDLQALCTAADEYGIKVIVDIVANHLANNGTDGGTYSYLNSGVESDMKNSAYYHTYNIGCSYDNRFHITQYHLGMPDLNTGNSYVQQKTLQLLKDCVDLGVDGFRFDAAKHIELPTDDSSFASDFWPTVINGIKRYKSDVFLYGEILDSAGTDISNYTKYMDVTDNSTGNDSRTAVTSGNASALANSSYYMGAGDSKSVLWVESHDTYEEGSSSGVSDANIIKAWGITGARANSTSLFLARPNSTMGAASSDTTWKSTAVAEINNFKNFFDGTSEYLASSGSVAYCERGTAGVSIVNLSGAGSVSLTAHTMASGIYYDRITGNKFTVSNGTISGTVGSTGVAVVYNPSDVVTTTSSSTSTDYYLFGYINGDNYACNDDSANMGIYKFSNGTLTATFDSDSYVAVKEADNANWYMTDGWLGTNTTTATLYNTSITGASSDKLYVPGGVQVNFTLVKNSDGSLTLSYTTGSTTDPVETTAASTTVASTTEPQTDGLTANLVYTGFDYDGAVWYAWTWGTSNSGSWVAGTNGTYAGLSENVIFARMNPNPKNAEVPSWEAVWNQTDDLTTIDGGTYTISGWGEEYLLGSWSQPSTTAAPTTAAPTTVAPTTVAPTTVPTTTVAPTTKADSGKTYYLFGFINGEDYACEEDAENMGIYKFTNGTLTAAFDDDAYVAVKEENNAVWYMTNGWQGEVNTATLYNVDITGENSDKLYVPGGVEVTFTLTENGDGTLTLSYTTTGGQTTTAAPTTEPQTDGLTANLVYTGFDYDGAVWYAWTWGTSNSGSWVAGTNGTYTGLSENVIFARMNPNPDDAEVPSWEAVWNQTDDLTTVDGGTYTISDWGEEYLLGSWSQPSTTAPVTAAPTTVAPTTEEPTTEAEDGVIFYAVAPIFVGGATVDNWNFVYSTDANLSKATFVEMTKTDRVYPIGEDIAGLLKVNSNLAVYAVTLDESQKAEVDKADYTGFMTKNKTVRTDYVWTNSVFRANIGTAGYTSTKHTTDEINGKLFVINDSTTGEHRRGLLGNWIDSRGDQIVSTVYAVSPVADARSMGEVNIRYGNSTAIADAARIAMEKTDLRYDNTDGNAYRNEGEWEVYRAELTAEQAAAIEAAEYAGFSSPYGGESRTAFIYRYNILKAAVGSYSESYQADKRTIAGLNGKVFIVKGNTGNNTTGYLGYWDTTDVLRIHTITVKVAYPNTVGSRATTGVTLAYSGEAIPNQANKIRMTPTNEAFTPETNYSTIIAEEDGWTVYAATLTADQYKTIDKSDYVSFVADNNTSMTNFIWAYGITRASIGEFKQPYDAEPTHKMTEFDAMTFVVCGNRGPQNNHLTGYWTD